MKDLTGKVAVVTGAGSGIGQALTVQLARAGAVVAAVDLSADSLGMTRERAADGTVHPLVVDVSDAAAVDTLADQVQGQIGPADILVNNAGIAIRADRFDRTSRADIDLLLAVNLGGVISCTHAFLPQLLARPEAALVNVSSLGGLVGFMYQVPYATSKFAIRGLSESLRMELHESAVTVTLVFPGPVRTQLFANSPVLEPGEKREAQDNLAKVRATDVDAAAAQILRGIRGKRARVLIGAETRAMDVVARLLPAAYTGLVYRPVSKMLAATRTAA
jgi:short-subunit dehydrogenase